MATDALPTLATLREVVAHAGDGALPEGWRFPEDEYDDEVDAILVERDWDGTTKCLYGPDARDLWTGYAMRRLLEAGLARSIGYTFKCFVEHILALPAAEARRVFARKDGES